MFSKIKNFIFTTCYMLLLARFIVLIGDPTQGTGAETGYLPIYDAWHSGIQMLYTITYYIQIPVDLLCRALLAVVPALKTFWFPYLPSSAITDALEKLMLANPTLPWPKPFKDGTIDGLFAGVVSWVPILTMGFLGILNPLVDKLADFLKNLVWNVLIEFSFTKKKQKVYQEALEKRAEALMKLNVEYKNLSKEASKLKDTIITDELTGVYNKRFFIERAKEEFEKAKQQKTPLALIMLDIDHFKKLNDNYGHLFGDVVLKQVSAIAKKATPNHCYCCRFGGEEFSIILPGKTYEEAMLVAEAVKNNVPRLQFEENPDVRVTISQGLIMSNFQSPEAQALEKFDAFIKLADDNLYRSKLDGRDRITGSKLD